MSSKLAHMLLALNIFVFSGGLLASEQPSDVDFLYQYRQSRGTDVERLEILQSAHVAGVERSKNNFDRIQIALEDTNSVEEKVELLKLSRSMYKVGADDEINRQVLKGLRVAMRSEDGKFAAGATLIYSRLGYFSDSTKVLRNAFERGVLNSDDYYGELAHLAWYARGQDSKDIVRTVANSRNRYAAQILAYSVLHNTAVEKVRRDSLEELRAGLLALPVKLNPTIGEFGIIEALEYSD